MAKIVPIAEGVTEDIPQINDADVKTAKKLYKEIEGSMVKLLEKAYNLGTILTSMKEEIGHGGFMDYVENTLGMNYKRCQRFMLVSSYKPQIEQQEPENLENAIELATKARAAEVAERKETELKMFEEYRVVEAEHVQKVRSEGSAADIAKHKLPPKPWDDVADSKERRNITNRYNSWLKKQLEAEKEPEVDEDYEPPNMEEIVDECYQKVMLTIERFESDKDQAEALALLMDRLSAGDTLWN